MKELDALIAADKAKNEVKVPKVAPSETMPEPEFKIKEKIGGPGSIPEFLKPSGQKPA